MKHKSRYQETQNFADDPRSNSQFKGVRPRDIPKVTGLLEHTVISGDRLDNLAHDYFENNRLWHHLGDANWSFQHGPDMVLDLGHNHDPSADPLEREDRTGQKILIPGRGN